MARFARHNGGMLATDPALHALSRGPLPERLALAAQADARAELLILLAADQAAPVRLAVAGNPCAPLFADQLLARDPVAQIRASLARKLATLAAEMAALRPDSAGWDTLRRLATDPARQVRQVIAETLADLPNAPHELVLGLSRDPDLAVSEPLIRLSRVLTEADLEGLIRTPPDPEARCAVAGRLNLSARLAESVLASGDVRAMTALLRNPTAMVPERLLRRLMVPAELEASLGEALAERGGATS